MLSRRSFLTRASLGAASATVVCAPHIARSAEELLTTPGQKPGRIIHIVSDGMSVGTLTCSDLFSQAHRDRGLTWVKLMSDPRTRLGLMNTRSLNSLVTDSAAASSAWGSGSRVTNGAINMIPDGRLLTPLYELFGQQKWGRGLVTTAEITHATPAGFAAAIKSRDNAQLIAAQYLDRQVEVLLGGGKPFFDGSRRKDKRDLRGDFVAAGYTVVKDLAGLDLAPTDTRLLGTFADSHLPYTLDQMADPKLKANVPTLAHMTRAALARLSQHNNFILQVEGARVDHAAHNSDAAAAIRDQIALDEAIDVCLEFQKQNPDTLIVITSDHGNSNLGINGMGGGYRQTPLRFKALAEIKASYPEILKRIQKVGEKIKVPSLGTDPEDKLDIPDPMAKVVPPGDEDKDEEPKVNSGVQMASALQIDPKAIADIIGEATGYQMSARRAGLFAKVLGGEYQALYVQMNSVVSQLGQLMANRVGVGWTGNTHTADYVQLLAIGPGSERFTGLLQNTDIFSHYTKLAGIDFQNPSVPLLAATDFDDAHDVEGSERYAWV
ncbi:MAG TPA: alkaline phosphatase [Chthoniobacteraceae bacterium]|nr:alkaline phosphatase [Chthoniobacteraceae bacterium]